MKPELQFQLINILRKIIREECMLLQIDLDSKNKSSEPTIKEFRESFILITKIGWLKGDTKFNKLFGLVESHGFLAVTVQEFKILFTGDGFSNKLIWLTYNTYLVYLFTRLMEEGFIPERPDLHSLLCKLFLDRDGNTLNRASLRSLLNQVRSERVEVIDKLIDELKAAP